MLVVLNGYCNEPRNQPLLALNQVDNALHGATGFLDNILSGVVEQMDDDALRIRSNSGTYELPSAHVEPGVLKGVEREFVVSADRVSFSVEEPSATNRVKCRLVSEEFIGSVVTVHCESADGHDFKLQLQERDLTQYELKSGSRVWLSWNTEDAHVPPTQQE